MTDLSEPSVTARGEPRSRASSAAGAPPLAVLQSLARGSLFFSWFLPSFSNLGYLFRRPCFSTSEFDFRDQQWLVTGASAGIGREIARRAALAGATVFAVARSSGLLEALAEEVEASAERVGAGRIVPIPADLSTVAVTAGTLAPDALPLPAGRTLDVLVNNVGIMLEHPATTSEGLDLALATNLVVPYLLTETLAATGRLTATSTVISMSSGGMYNVPMELRALLPGRHYNGTLAYAFHKRAQVVLNRYWQEMPAYPFASYVMHPGWVDTPGVRSSMPEFYRLTRPLLRDLTAGADTALWLAAMRPAHQRPGGIWLDRKRRPEHLLPGTRGGASGTELVDFLELQVAQAQGHSVGG